MSDLAEFLLARIAEDLIDMTITPGPARVLAECGAKRRIVERIAAERREAWHRTSVEHHQSYKAWAAWYPADPVLADLASVYADHPDYRKEWLS